MSRPHQERCEGGGCLVGLGRRSPRAGAGHPYRLRHGGELRAVVAVPARDGEGERAAHSVGRLRPPGPGRPGASARKCRPGPSAGDVLASILRGSGSCSLAEFFTLCSKLTNLNGYRERAAIAPFS